jgi:excisionase family DNA binding protein
MAARWLRTGQVAKLLGVPAATVQSWCRTGQIVCRQTPGGQYQCTVADVEAFLKRMTDRAFRATAAA